MDGLMGGLVTFPISGWFCWFCWFCLFDFVGFVVFKFSCSTKQAKTGEEKS